MRAERAWDLLQQAPRASREHAHNPVGSSFLLPLLPKKDSRLPCYYLYVAMPRKFTP
jgi:hypothetical protein